jgi:hypothetical protein
MNAYFVEEYSTNCNLYLKNYKKFKIFSFDLEKTKNKKVSELTERYLKIARKVKKCISNGTRIIIIPITLVRKNSNSTHANLLIFRVEEGTMERFEPQGSSYGSPHDDYIFDKNIQWIIGYVFEPVLNMRIVYKRPILSCPYPTGLQLLASNVDSLIDGNGFCRVWSLLINELVLMNPELSTKKIVDDILLQTKLNPLYLRYLIRGYSKHMEEVVRRELRWYEISENFGYETTATPKERTELDRLLRKWN